MKWHAVLSPRPAVQAAAAMGDLVLAALLGVLLQGAGGIWLPALPPAVVWAAVSTLRFIKARVAAERVSIALYRILGGSMLLLAGRAVGEALLLFLPAALASLLAAAWLLPVAAVGGSLPLPDVLPALAGAAIAAAAYAARLVCRIAPAYGVTVEENDLPFPVAYPGGPGLAGQGAGQGALTLLHKLYGYVPPLAARPAAYLDGQWRALRATFFLLISALVLGKQGHAEPAQEDAGAPPMAAQDDAHIGLAPDPANDGAPVVLHREAFAAGAISLINEEDHLALRNLAGLPLSLDLPMDAARQGGRELLLLSGVPWQREHAAAPVAEGASLPALAPGVLPVHVPGADALLPVALSLPLPLPLPPAQITVASGKPLKVPLLLVVAPLTGDSPVSLPTETTPIQIGDAPELSQAPVQLVGISTLVGVHVVELGKA